jgi:hypothetical protein
VDLDEQGEMMKLPQGPKGKLVRPEADSRRKGLIATVRVATGRPAPLLGFTVFLTLGALVPLAIVLATAPNGYAAWVGASVIATASAARFAWTIGSRERHLVEMVINIFVYGFLGVAPLVQLRMRAEVGTTPGFISDYASTTVLVILTGFAAICFGSFLATFRGSRLPDRPSRHVKEIRAGRVVAITIFALAAAAYYVAKMGIQTFLQPRLEVSARLSEVFPDDTTAALVVGVTSMSLLVALVSQIGLFRQRRRIGLAAPLPLMIATGLVLLFVVNPVGSARYAVGTVYLAILAAVGIWGTLRRYRIISILTMVSLFFLFPIASTFRNSLSAQVSLQNPLDSLLSGDFDSFDQINNTVSFVATRGITWGDQLLGVVFFWVPRSLWPGKAIDTGVLLAEFRGYSFKNLSAPLWAELFINGSWPLLIIGMTLLGFMARRWDRGLNAQVVATGTPTLLGCIVPFYLLIILRGSLLQAMASLAVVVVLSWVVTAAGSRGAQSGSSGTQKAPSPIGR